jgi:poly(A) polymerase
VDRRHPGRVRYGTLEEDVRRRDFTVNALYYDPLAGRLIDRVGGREDLARRRLRAVGPARERFDEDALRLIRAVRFAVRYDLKIEKKTREAILPCAPHLGGISAERVAEELLRILTGPRPGQAMGLTSELGLWMPIVPEIEAMHGCEQPDKFHPEGDVFVHTALVLDALAEAWGGPPPGELAMGALLHDIGKPPTKEFSRGRIRFPEHQRVGAEMADAICRRLRFSARLRRQVVELVGQHMRFMDVGRMKRSTLRRLLGRKDIALHLALHKADCLACHEKLENWELCRRMMEEFAEEGRQEALLPPPLVNGHDLLEMGLEPGPRVGALLEAAREAQLEGELRDRNEALAWLRERMGEER